MVKKTLLSLAIAATAAGLAGCNLSTTDKYENDISTAPIITDDSQLGVNSTWKRPDVAPYFSPATSRLPLNTDLVFSKAKDTDGTADTADTTPPVTTAVNQLAGFSTIAPFMIEFDGALAEASVLPKQTVFLIELKNAADVAGIDALDLVSIAEKTENNPVDAAATQALDYDARYVQLADGKHVIQVLPQKPLNPKTKYVVVVTDGVKSATGGDSGPGFDYYALARENVPVPSPALTSVRKLLTGLESIAGGFLSLVSGGTLGKDNIILTYPFTTDSGIDVFKSYAAPAIFVSKNLSVAQAEVLTDSAAGVPAGFSVVARTIAVRTAAGNPDLVPTAEQLGAVTAETIATVKDSPSYPGALYSVIASSDLQDLLGTEAPITIEGAVNAPAPRDVALIPSASVDAVLALNSKPNGASPATFLGTADTATRYIQGQIKLPDFLDLPTLTTTPTAAGITAALRADKNWSANTTVGSILDGALGQPAGTTPPKDVNGTTNVTYRYPFPQSVGTNTAPLLITLPAKVDYSAGGTNPAGSDCTNVDEFPVVIYVHGITGSRANMLPYSAGLAANCVASVAIDLPLHGVAPFGSNSNGAKVANQLLPFNVEPGNAAATGSPWAGVAAQVPDAPFANLKERHGNIYQFASSTGALIRKPIVFGGENAEGDSGSAFINLQNFGRTRDNLRQAVVDLLNLNASLANIDTALGGDVLDLANVSVVGHSLGSIVATTFVAVNNDPVVQAYNKNLNPIKSVVLANGGAHITKFLESSPSFAPTILKGLAGGGIQQGTENFEKYMYVLQSAIDSVEPANAAAVLAEQGTPVVLFNMVGGAALPAAGAALDKISLPDGFKSSPVVNYVPDHTVPNYAYFADGVTNPFANFVNTACFTAQPDENCVGLAMPSTGNVKTGKAPLAGTDGLSAVLDLESVNSGEALDASNRTEVRMSAGTHSTFANADAPLVFGEMVQKTLQLIQSASN